MTADATTASSARSAVDDGPRRGTDDDRATARALEAVLLVADEPQSLLSLAAAVGRPTTEVRRAVADLVADFDEIGRAHV